MIIWKHVQCREKDEIGVTYAPTKSHQNIFARHFENDGYIGFVTLFAQCSKKFNAYASQQRIPF